MTFAGRSPLMVERPSGRWGSSGPQPAWRPRPVVTRPALDVLGAVPANVRVERFVPQADLLGRATAVVSHGGAGKEILVPK